MSRRQQRLNHRTRVRRVLYWAVTGSIAFLIIIVGMRFYSRAMETFFYYSREVVTPRMGSLEYSESADAIILNEEETYYAPAEGYFKNTVKEGERVGAGSTAGYFITVQGQRIKVTVPATGIYSEYTDGLEKAFKNIPLDSLAPTAFSYKIVRNTGDSHYYKDAPVFKIINNLKPVQLLVRLHHLPPAGMSIGSSVIIERNNMTIGKASIQRIFTGYKENIVLLACQDFSPLSRKYRYFKINIGFDHQEGAIIPVKSLKNKGKEKGIYCIKGEKIYFKSVKILKTQDHWAIVEGLEANDLVVVNH